MQCSPQLQLFVRARPKVGPCALATAMLTAWHASVAMPCWRRTALRFFSSAWQVSSHGRVCNTRGVISSGYLHGSGYKFVHIFQQKWRVHRLVKITFHGLPKSPEAWQVHHVDGNAANNRLDNLEYVTPSENMRYAFSNPSRRSNGPARSKPVLWRPIGSTSWTYCASAKVLAQHLGIHRNTVAGYCHNNSAAKGYEFRFPDASGHTLPGEEWRPMILDQRGRVFGRTVSSFGRITSQTGLISQGSLTRQGYYTTRVRINSRYQNIFVHRLVAFAFLGPPPTVSQTFVNHKDLDKANNAADNLEWVSQAENMAHFYTTSTFGQGTTARPVWSRPHGTNDTWTWHHSMTSAAHELGLNRKSISNCAQKKQWQTGGFEFQLVDTPEAVSSLPGEEWREVDELVLQRDREACKRVLFT